MKYVCNLFWTVLERFKVYTVNRGNIFEHIQMFFFPSNSSLRFICPFKDVFMYLTTLFNEGRVWGKRLKCYTSA